MINSLIHGCQQCRPIIPGRAIAHDQKPFERASIRVIVLHVRKVAQHLEQHSLVIGFAHGGCSSLVGNDAGGVLTEGSNPHPRIGGAA